MSHEHQPSSKALAPQRGMKIGSFALMNSENPKRINGAVGNPHPTLIA